MSASGYDDVPEAAWAGYRLTTIAQPTDPMIEATVSILLEQVGKQEIKRRATVLPAEIVVRDTARIPG